MAITSSLAASLSSLPAVFPLAFLGLLALPWTIIIPRLGLALLFISLIIGQLVRFPLPGQGGGLLLSDIAVVLVIISALFQLIAKKTKICHLSFVIGISLSPFMLWSLITLTIHLADIPFKYFAIGLSYWLRLTAHLLLLPALLLLFQSLKTRIFALKALMLTTGALAILGLAQLVFFPNILAEGWDPHQGRLVATWLDPNFLGAFFILTIPVFLSRPRPVNLFLASSVSLSLILTQSRSSLLALFIAVALLSPLYVPKIKRPILMHSLIFAILAISLTIFLIPDRLVGLLTIDPTVTLRAQSLLAAWPLAQDNTLTGVGYNLYQFSTLESSFTQHSRAGTDNSYLTLWITTGLAGLVLFLLPFFYIANNLIRQWLKNRSLLSLAALISLTNLSIHANFINSFLYSHLLITISIIIALALSSWPTKTTSITG